VQSIQRKARADHRGQNAGVSRREGGKRRMAQRERSRGHGAEGIAYGITYSTGQVRVFARNPCQGNPFEGK